MGASATDRERDREREREKENGRENRRCREGQHAEC